METHQKSSPQISQITQIRTTLALVTGWGAHFSAWWAPNTNRSNTNISGFLMFIYNVLRGREYLTLHLRVGEKKSGGPMSDLHCWDTENGAKKKFGSGTARLLCLFQNCLCKVPPWEVGGFNEILSKLRQLETTIYLIPIWLIYSI